VIVWLWDAAGPACGACGVTADRKTAKSRARACIRSGQAIVAQVQAAEFLAGDDVLDPYYRRFGNRWQARDAQGISFRWRLLAASAT
jgi:hypothetical protein